MYAVQQAICKSAGSVPPWMAVIPHRNEICEMQILQLKNIHGRIFFNVPAGVFCSRLVSGTTIFKSAGKAKAARWYIW